MVKYKSRILDATFRALADPTRRAILHRLAGGECSVTALADPFDISLPAISKHLRVLENAGLLIREKEGRVRRCCLVAKPLKEAAGWIAGYQQFWEQQFDRLAHYLNESGEKEGQAWLNKHQSRKRRSGSRRPSRRRARKSSRHGPTQMN